MAPMVSCPGAPMLNRPVRNANATLRPVKISGVASFRLSSSGFRAVTGANSVEYTKYTRSDLASHAPHRLRGVPLWFTLGCTISTTTAPTSTASPIAAAGTSRLRMRLKACHTRGLTLRPAPAAISPARAGRNRPRFMPPLA